MALIASIQSEDARAMMLAMLAEEIEVRVTAMKILARNGNYHHGEEHHSQQSPGRK